MTQSDVLTLGQAVDSIRLTVAYFNLFLHVSFPHWFLFFILHSFICGLRVRESASLRGTPDHGCLQERRPEASLVVLELLSYRAC